MEDCRIYCTTYCNKGHLVRDGRPVGHECHVLPPEALRLEREGDVKGALEVLSSKKPLRVHRGVKEREKCSKRSPPAGG